MIHPVCVHLYCLVRLSRRAHIQTHTHTHTHTHTQRERDVHALEALKSRRHPAVLADGEDNKERKTVVDRCLQGGCETGIREIKRAHERMRKRGSATERTHITSSSKKEQKEEEEETAEDEREAMVCQ